MCEACDDLGAGPDEVDPVRQRQWFDQSKARFRELVRTHGWAIQAVSGGSSRDEPPFAYTVGLWGLGHPEIVVFGLGQSSAAFLLNTLGARVKEGSPTLRDGDEVVLETVPVRFFNLPNAGQVLFVANDFYNRRPGEPVQALQAVYPDEAGRWPWEPGCTLRKGSQPMPGTFAA